MLDAFKWNFTGVGQGQWNNPVNWIQNGLPAERFPTSADDVTFDGSYAAGQCDVLAGAGDAQCASLKLINNPGQITLDSGLTIMGGSLGSVMTSGTLQVQSGKTLAIAGNTFNWSGGTITGLGSVAVGGTGSPDLIINGNAQSLACSLTVGTVGPGIIDFQTLNQDFTFGAGQGITVDVSGTLIFEQASGNIKSTTGGSSPGSVIANQGTVNFNTSAAITCDLPIYNSNAGASLNVLQGTLEFTTGAPQSGYSISQSAGIVSLSSGATLKADSNVNINGGELVTLGDGNATLTGNLTVQAGDIYIANTGGGYGELSVNGQLALIGTSQLHIYIDNRVNLYDWIWVSGNVTLGWCPPIVAKCGFPQVLEGWELQFPRENGRRQ